jgi:hemerythrin-like domain-containing protein
MNDSLIDQLPGFDNPLGILKACHQRMLAHCEILEKLQVHIGEKGVDQEARSAISKVKTYFSTSAVHHHQDEEEDLFPILARQSLKLADVVHSLHKEHEAINQAWDDLQTSLKQSGELANNADFGHQVKTFCHLYREHINHEEKELLSMAQHILSHEQLKELGNNMAKRRGVQR